MALPVNLLLMSFSDGPVPDITAFTIVYYHTFVEHKQNLSTSKTVFLPKHHAVKRHGGVEV